MLLFIISGQIDENAKDLLGTQITVTRDWFYMILAQQFPLFSENRSLLADLYASSLHVL